MRMKLWHLIWTCTHWSWHTTHPIWRLNLYSRPKKSSRKLTTLCRHFLINFFQSKCNSFFQLFLIITNLKRILRRRKWARTCIRVQTRPNAPCHTDCLMPFNKRVSEHWPIPHSSYHFIRFLLLLLQSWKRGALANWMSSYPSWSGASNTIQKLWSPSWPFETSWNTRKS